ncbi:hypothetical protein XNC1_4647 [Xenorhabdus nematophila ATCC 19061]|uniref:Uncharacterized protein n=1 Tax=Xenorhabdus nematophila (strain ATCC 19061 / DSM 3370 / CCUG 14189 / LMG 1036 / NCIMB 9965 / AN6) TaxID=406817 RepID=D3VG03_XENNA|nr:hypothetical protein XNC1_4647 [Xenorhabdus nematophila ATCC 19061]
MAYSKRHLAVVRNSTQKQYHDRPFIGDDLCMILALYCTVRIILHPACDANDFFRLYLAGILGKHFG